MLLYPFSCRYWKKNLNIGWKNTTAMWNKNSTSWMFWRFVSRILCSCQSGTRAHSLPSPPPVALAMLATDHFRVDPSLFSKARQKAKLLIWKWVFILMQIKLIFTRKVLHVASLWQRVFGTWKWPICGVPFSLWRVSNTEYSVLASKIDFKAILIVLF